MVAYLHLACISVAAVHNLKTFVNSLSVYVCGSFIDVLPI
jgi:hypothetical protein